VPAYNEGDSIVATLEGLRAGVHVQPSEILVVYDFDEDTTVPVVRRLQERMPDVRLLRNSRGGGALNAIKSGFDAARGPLVLVTMADLSDDPADIDRMHALAVAGADVVAGSRYMRGGRQLGGPPLKRLLSRMAGLSLHHLAGVATHDATNNFRMYSRRLLDSVTIESIAGFELALELTVKAHMLGLRIAEVPTTWRDRTAGESRFRISKWIPHYMRWYRVGMLGRFRRKRVARDGPPTRL
jgi:glycosyltransferase involved in cell wall biosynthesis